MANRIKELRSKAEKSMQEISEKTGIKKSTIASYETRGINPNAEKSQILADYFDVSVLYLLGYSDDKEVSEAQIRPATDEEMAEHHKKSLINMLNDGEMAKNMSKDERLVDILCSYIYSNPKGQELLHEFSNYITQNPEKFFNK